MGLVSDEQKELLLIGPSVLVLLLEVKGNTASTPSPTAAVTKTPTRSPTRPPTKTPTVVPTAASTKTPTANPTIATTQTPSIGKTVVPSTLPTTAPSSSTATTTPTAAKTSLPTTSPTIAVTNAPTVSKTAAPTTTPTIANTAIPTVKATTATTVAPSSIVTKTPTLSPTVKTHVPTAKTTVAPTVTQTTVPSVAITTTPTFAKTNAPTIATTAAPTIAVTSKPTVSQTNAPTAAKTTAPTVAATVTVTSSPTASQTNAPTAGKTNAPTIQSSIPPTVKSTTAPTIPSTRNPTIKSTQAPSVKATRAPTVKVSPQPTSRRWRFTFNWYSWYSSSSVSSIAQVGTMSSSSAASIYQANAVNFFLDNNIGISAGIVANSFSDTDTELYTALKRCASAGSDQCQLIVEGGATTTTSSTLDVVKSQIQSADEKIKSYFPGYTPSVYVPTTTWNNNTLAAAKAVGFSAVAPAGNSIAWNLQSSPLQLSPQTSTGIQNTTGTWVANPTDSIVSDCTAAANRGEVCVIQITANEFASGAYTITQLQEVIDALKASGFSSDTVTLQTIISEAQATTPTLAPTNNPLTSSTGATDNGVWSPADYLIGVIVVAGLLIMAGITYAVILARNYNQNHDVIKINSSSSDLECASNDNLITGSVEIDEEKSLPSSIRRSVQYDEQYSVDVPRPPSGSHETQSPIVSEV
eukprot:gene11981-13077_t